MLDIVNKIKGVGLDCSTLSYRPDPIYLPDTLYIDSSSNNAFYLEGLVKDKQIIVRAGSLLGIEDIVRGMKLDLGVDYIDVLLLPARSLAEENIEELRDVLDREEVGSVGIERPKDLKELISAVENLKKVILPTYLAISLNPLHFQKEIVDWSEENELEIIGLDIYGSLEGSAATIQAFTLPFLLSYAASYSEVVILPARDLVGAGYERVYLEELIGKNRLPETKMNNSVIHDFQSFPTMIHTSIKSEYGFIPYTNPFYLTDPEELELGMEPKEASYKSKRNKIMESIMSYCYSIQPPPQEQSGWSTYLSIVRPMIVKELRKTVGKDADINQAKIGNLVFLLSVTTYRREKRWIGPDKRIPETTDYVLFMTNWGIKFECY